MQTISSDTNVWIDFQTINRLELPFYLPYIYIMYHESIDNELLNPKDLSNQLQQAGLQGVDITIEEFLLAEQYATRFPKLSIPDSIALAIAKERQITLLTGDRALRCAATAENVPLLGTIGILDELYYGEYIPESEYIYCLEQLLQFNGGAIRLPTNELQRRLDKISQS